MAFPAIIRKLLRLEQDVSAHELNLVSMSEECLHLTNRVTNLELAGAGQLQGGSDGSIIVEGIGPAGKVYPGGAIVAPITFLEEGDVPIPGAAITAYIIKS